MLERLDQTQNTRADEESLRNSQEGVRDQIPVVQPAGDDSYRVDRCAG